MTAPPITDHLPVALRAFAQPTYRPKKEVNDGSRRKREPSKKSASPWTVIFDTETTSDAAQSLRFGTFQVRHHGELDRNGIFYAPDGVKPGEREALDRYAATHGLEVLTRDEFVQEILYGVGYACRAMIVGFNLPFDLSRIALRHESARGDMRGGFSLTMSEQKTQPNIRIKHLSRSAAFIKFAGQFVQIDSGSDRNNGRQTPANDGHFLDIKTLAKALFARSFDLAGLCEFLGVEHPKQKFEDFGRDIDDEMIAYAVRDTLATWECYVELIARFERLKLTGTRPEDIISEASIGKAYLRAMRIGRWQDMQGEFPPQLLANIMGSYFGGRAEVRIRREVRQVIHCDFLSMYPTVCTLMNLWPFVRGQAMTWRDSTAEVRDLLNAADLPALQSPDFWKGLTTLVRVEPDADIFPVRAAYDGKAATTIGANYLSADIPLWFTLADCIASKLLTGKAPKMSEAITYAPGPVQKELRPIDVNGIPAYRVDPAQSDFFKRVIELRQDTKARRDASTGDEWARLDTEQNALKIAANATSYGIYMEVNVDDLPERQKTTVHASTCDHFTYSSEKMERPGPCFHPMLGTLICGAARLMLAITERLVVGQGLEWSFCDTDRMAIAKPEDMAPAGFAQRVSGIVDWFATLNPYDFDGSILQVEKVNTALDKSGPEPLYCWALSAKRYALFNLDENNAPVLRKISAHGLGHLLAPYDAQNPAPNIPAPDKSVLKDGVEHWQHDFWWQIVNAAVNGDPDEIDLTFHDEMGEPAVSRYGATTPELLDWFKTYNEGRTPRDQVKPFNFLLAMIADTLDTDETMVAADVKASRGKPQKWRPIAPYGRDHAKAVQSAFDRVTGKPVPKDRMVSYADALAQYHIHPEAKFLNGKYADRGTTVRRHVLMIGTRHIGKEAHDLERQAYIGIDPEAVPAYGTSGIDRDALVESIKRLIADIGLAHTVKALATTPSRLQRFVAGKVSRSDEGYLQAIAIRLPAAQTLAEKVSYRKRVELHGVLEAVERDGHNATARRLGVDPSNLRRIIRKARSLIAAC